MSQNRFIYDSCEFMKRLEESTNPLCYVLDRSRYENCGKCRHEFGLVGGTAVSHIKSNMVDLESDLRNQTRPATLCPAGKWHPVPKGAVYQTPNTITTNGVTIDTNMLHLPPCQIVRYPSIPLPMPKKCC
jgi:hypothetical protein